MARIVLKILIFLLPMEGFAQKNFYKLAEKAFVNEEYYSAIENYKRGYEKTDHDNKAEILFKVGICYMKISDYKQAEVWFSKSIKAKYPDPIAWYYLAACKKYLMKYDEAIVDYQNYLKEVPGSGQTFINSCDQAKEWMDKPTSYVLENMDMINSKDDDLLPVFEKKDSSLYFVSNREGGNGSQVDLSVGKNNSDIYFTALDKNGKWSMPFPEGDFINSVQNENSFCFDSVNSLFYFSRDITVKTGKRSLRKNKLFYVLKNSKKDFDAMDFCKTDTGSFNFETPFFISDLEFIFSSDMPGGFGGYDLWRVQWNDKTKRWNKPVNLGATVNSSFNEKAPYISESHLLYFSSDREGGMGGYDIYTCKQPGFIGEEWKEAENMKYPMNSSADDMGIIFDGAKQEGYLSSNRLGGKGGYDIFKFYRKGN